MGYYLVWEFRNTLNAASIYGIYIDLHVSLPRIKAPYGTKEWKTQE
jgi:hypothetical protein